jgi:hypothetical protein
MTNIGQVGQAYLSDLSVWKRKKGDVYMILYFSLKDSTSCQ